METPDRIEHYRLEEKLGQGGMGVVYRAWDEDLERWVAIKFIQQGRQESVSGQKRFRREALTVARLVHPAIVQIHHILRFEGGEGIVMELVEGESLAKLLAAGPLAPEAALPLLLEISEGLAYAHGEGFMHRDLKSENVMVTRGGHAKILDFGLAKWSMRTATSLSEEGAVLGTLRTMSPEQAQALEVDERTDLFSLGVLGYEILTGTSPFRATTPRETLARVIYHHPKPVAELTPTVPQELSDLIEQLLAKEPPARPHGATEVVEVLARCAGTRSRLNFENWPSKTSVASPASVQRTPSTVPTHVLDSRPTHREPATANSAIPDWGRQTLSSPWESIRSLRLRSLLVVLVLLVALGASGYFFLGTQDHPVVFVADFENHTGNREMDWLGGAIAQSLTADLVVDENALEPTISPRNKRHREWLGLDYGVDFLVVGTYSSEPGDTGLHIHLELRDVQSDRLLFEEPFQGREEEILHLVRERSVEIRRTLGLEEMSAEQTREAQMLFPSEFQAARLYTQAMERLQRSDEPQVARKLLMEALQHEPENPLLHDALAQTLRDLGYLARAKDEARRAWELSSASPRRQRLEIEARYYESIESWDEVLRVHRLLAREYAHITKVLVRLAEKLMILREFDEAQRILEELGNRSLSTVEEAQIGATLAEIQLHRRDYETANDSAARAAAQANSAGAPYLEAWAKIRQGVAQSESGRDVEALAAFDHARRLFDQSNSRRGVLSSATHLAITYAQQGKYREAMERFQHYREIYRKRGDSLMEAQLNVNLANVWSDLGRLNEAEPLLLAAVESLETLEARHELALARVNLGTVQQESGRLSQAQVLYEEAIGDLEELGEEVNLAQARVNLAEVLYWSGDLQGGQEQLEKALIFLRANQEPDSWAYGELRLGEFLAARDRANDARHLFQEGLEKLYGDTPLRPEIELAFARFELERENLEAARELAERSERMFLERSLDEMAALARIVQARTYLESRTPDLHRARLLYEDAEFGASSGENFQVPIELVFLAARIAEHDSAGAVSAMALLEKLAQEVRERGFVPYLFEVELALGELEIKTGAPVEGRTRLKALATEARRRGFEAVERRAESAMRRDSTSD